MIRATTLLVLLLAVSSALSAPLETYTGKLTPLIAPAKLATLGERGANPRIQKAVAILEDARADGFAVALVASNAVAVAGYTNALLAEMTRAGLARNHDIATKLGVLTPEGLERMRRGNSPTITLGPYKGDKATVNHIVPRAVAPELGRVIANLELMPGKLNSSKGDKIGDRQRAYARKFQAAGVLTDARRGL